MARRARFRNALIHSYEPSGKSTAQVQRANLEKFLAYPKKDESRPTVLKITYSDGFTAQAMQLDASFLRDYHLYSEIHFLESPVNQDMQRNTLKHSRRQTSWALTSALNISSPPMTQF